MPVLPLAVTAILFFLRFGYDYGAGDQDEIIPYLLHRLDAGLFTRDWFVQTQTESFSIRAYTVLLLHGLSLVFPVWLAVLSAYVASWTALAVGIYHVAKEWLDDRVAASATLLVALVLTPQWTLGGNDFASGMLTPTELSWAFAIWGIWFFLRRRPMLAGLLLGLATCFQALVGLHAAIIVGLVLIPDLLHRESRRHAALSLARFGILYLLAAALMLGPILYRQFVVGAPDGLDPQQVFYILAAFRNPHHYLLSSFPAASVVKFGLLALSGGTALIWLHRNGRLRHAAFITRAVGGISVLLALNVLFTDVWPVLLVAKLQFFKLTVLLKLVFIAGICGAAVLYLPGGLYRLLSALARNTRSTLLLSAVLVSLLMIGIATNPASFRIGPMMRQQHPLTQIEEWARSQTSENALFAVPPSSTTFRSGARRAIAANFKAFPFEDRLMPVWLDHLTDVAPIPPPERGGFSLIPQLDAAYHAHSAAAWRRLARLYEIDYVVREGVLPGGADGMDVAYRAGEWVVYRFR